MPEALEEADVVVNLTNSPTFDDGSPGVRARKSLGLRLASGELD